MEIRRFGIDSWGFSRKKKKKKKKKKKVRMNPIRDSQMKGKQMNSRERLLAALNHKEPDRVPIDLGGTPTSTISLKALEKPQILSGTDFKTRVMSPIFMTAYPDERS